MKKKGTHKKPARILSTRIARQLGKRGGAAGTAKQHAARQRNAQRAGRPRRVCLYCDQPVIGGHVDRTRDESCGQHGWRWQQRSGLKSINQIDTEISDLYIAIADLQEMRAMIVARDSLDTGT